MSKTDSIRDNLGEFWIPAIYESKVRTQRTRAVEMPIPARENGAEILYTLLGIELKVGKRRIACPDLATARYLRVFARVGCRNVAVPYNITKVYPLADLLETAWQRAVLLIEMNSKELSPASASRMRSVFVKTVRDAVETIGAGEIMPEFKQSTKQRIN
jgi:hypothetical protein